MAGALRLIPPATIEGSLRPPGSKSLTNRALICAALGTGHSEIRQASLSEDSRLLLGALARHGHRVRLNEADRTLHVHPRPARELQTRASFHLGNAGTSLRFLVSYLCTHRGKFLVDGSPRMRERPIGPLLDALNRLGGNVRSTFQTGCPPVAIDASGLRGGSVDIPGDVSSQFISSILLAAPASAQGVRLALEGAGVSRPYVRMTLDVMRAFGMAVEQTDNGYRVDPGSYRAAGYVVEPDASGATYFMGLAAVLGGRVRIEGLARDSAQGDVRFADILESMGCPIRWSPEGLEVRGGGLRGIDIEMSDVPDAVPTLAVLALFASGETHIRGISHLRHKETDRIAVLEEALTALGAKVEADEDSLHITPPAAVRPARIKPYGDHRMVMSFAVAAARVPEIVLEDPDCVAKSFPGFFETLGSLGIRHVRTG